MTTTPAREPAEASLQPAQSPNRGDTAVSIAGQMARSDFRRGDLAELRRMDVDAPDPAAFWRLMAENELLGRGAVLESKWALILHGIALMTPTGNEDNARRSAHDGHTPVGRALFLGNETTRQTGFYSESRLNRLLTARGPMLRTLLTRLFRMMASAGQSFDWYQMTGLILNDGHDEERADDVRRRIARDYYWAESRANRPQT
jgi:CRISPR system Cascade subunit CasB